jgi:uncharacterized protein DUF4384
MMTNHHELNRHASGGREGLMSRCWKVMLLAALMCPVGAVNAEPQAPAPASRLDFDYGFVVERDGKQSELSALNEARTGDRFHVRLRPRQPLHAYLFTSKDARTFELVLPNEKRRNTGAQVAKNTWSTLPDQDWLVFNKTAGIERLYLFLSSEEIEPIESLYATKPTADAVDETWLIDLRNRLDGDGVTNRDRSAALNKVTHRRRGAGPAVLVETITIRHKQ